MMKKLIFFLCWVSLLAGCSGPITIQVTDDNGYDGETVIVDGAGCGRPYPCYDEYVVDDYYYYDDYYCDDYYYYGPGYYDGYVYYDDVYYIDGGYYYDDYYDYYYY